VAPEIEVINVSKTFTIRHNKADSFKSKVIGVFHKRYRERREILWALKDVSFTVTPGEAFGVIGANGSGKSTLLKIIGGIYSPSHGMVHLPGNGRIGTIIELGVGFHADLTGKENIFLGASVHGLSRKEIDEIYGAVVEFSELQAFIDTPIKNYSTGMCARLGFALAVNLNPRVLLVDEVLSVGDESFQRKCTRQIEKIRRDGKTIVFVSHNPQAVKAICDRACVLDHGALAFLGKSDEAIEHYHRILAQ